ncbi:transposase, IS605 family [Coleofasciculus chthonoplastes PCC 7420]|uniref:Transposase, IS605 family n=1 Tax=Coleofasciculus chthonoplastes PCC 7420 TaxID=118168 RepID=B4VRC9_9CYAN|nr:RNA-guided endonuclease TnpB family protein [Coleofasciculus chthonoplastes]EDX75458.1 transposase, IS605 family [Coleofasciculus chthonoplastes PCC 7420]
MNCRYQFRIYPTPGQRQSLARLFGCVRVVWNDALFLCKQSGKLPGSSELQKLCITQAKKTEAREWLGQVSAIPLQQSVADLGVAFKNFFQSRSGKRKGKKVNPPRFKRRVNRQTARFTRGGFRVKASKVYLAKTGNLKVKWSRPLPSVPSSVTVIKDCAGRYFLSFVVEVEPEIKQPLNPSIGVDLGLKTFASCSNGEKIDSPDYSRLYRKLKRCQRRLAKRERGSKRRERMRVKVAKLNAQIRDKRKDFLHKLSTKVVNDNQVIALEDLNVSGMLKNRKLSRAISQAGWYEFRSLCEGKANKHNRDFRVISRWEPTSQVCSDCGYRWGKIDLSVRSILCINCGAEHDRDDNASVNIEQVGVGQTHDSKRTGSACKTSSEAVCVEPSTHRKYIQLNLFDW